MCSVFLVWFVFHFCEFFSAGRGCGGFKLWLGFSVERFLLFEFVAKKDGLWNAFANKRGANEEAKRWIARKAGGEGILSRELECLLDQANLKGFCRDDHPFTTG